MNSSRTDSQNPKRLGPGSVESQKRQTLKYSFRISTALAMIDAA